MRVASSPNYQPGHLIAPRLVLWYALMLVPLLLALAALAVAVASQVQPADAQLLGPFRWMKPPTIA